MNGGYVMFDASVLDLDNGGTLTGLYAKMQELFESGKPLLLCNIKYTTHNIKAEFGSIDFDSPSYYIGFQLADTPYYIEINNDDSYSLS